MGLEHSMDELTRRSFVKRSAGAAVGVSVLGAIVAEPAEAALKRSEKNRARTNARNEHKGLVAYLPDHHSDEIALMHGDHTVIIRDRALAARLARHAR